MARSVWQYFEERERECERLSLVPLSPGYFELAGSDETRGRIVMRLGMTERAYLEVSERVAVHEGYVHREEYAYYLVIDGQEYWSRDYDPHHGYHGHESGHERVKAPRVTFKETAEQAWEIVSREEELAETQGDEDR